MTPPSRMLHQGMSPTAMTSTSRLSMMTETSSTAMPCKGLITLAKPAAMETVDKGGITRKIETARFISRMTGKYSVSFEAIMSS